MAAPAPGAGASQRLFIALVPDETVRRELAAAAHALCAGGRPVPPENLHLTLAFLGNVAPARVADAAVAMREAGPLPFDMALTRFGQFSKPGLVWLGPQRPPPLLQVLHRRLEARLRVAGFDFETRELRPHVTLAREAALPAYRPAVRVIWQARSAALLRSTPANGGVHYEALETIDF
jgi:2'-5' RNA ligase